MSRSIIVVPCYNEAERLDAAAFRGFVAAHPSLGFVPVVVLTTFSEKAVQVRCIERGASAFFAKPYDKDIFLATVRRVAMDYQRRRMTRAAIRAG